MLVAGVSALAATPCETVDRSLTSERKTVMAPEIARQLKAKTVEISQSFRFGGWSIYYVATNDADDTYVFYSGDPRRRHYVTMWGGVALPDEEQDIKAWVIKNAPGIPRGLAGCFAWHVTKER
jgi:hypothetical protein